MKIEKINGLYRKRRIRYDSGVPLLVWLPLLLVSSAVLIAISLQTHIIQDQLNPERSAIRKHSWRIVAVGDIACDPNDPGFNAGNGIVDACQMKAVGEAVEREQKDAVILLGDIQYDTGEFVDFEKSFVPYWRDIREPLYVVAGNHDYGQGNLNDYTKVFTTYFPRATHKKETVYYETKFGGWTSYMLDSNCAYISCEENGAQYNWLTSKLTMQPVCSIAAWHHPLHTSGVHGSDTDIESRRALWQLLNSSGTDILLTGHDHHYERFAPMNTAGDVVVSGIRQFVVGTGGRSLRVPEQPYETGSEKVIADTFGYLVFELFPGRYEWQYKNTVGDILDSGLASCR